jgi:uncharacterized protein (TIGR03435 family)
MVSTPADHTPLVHFMGNHDTTGNGCCSNATQGRNSIGTPTLAGNHSAGRQYTSIMYIKLGTALPLFLLIAHAQPPASFDVASVKPNLSGRDQSTGVNIIGSRIRCENLSLRTLILQAYDLLDFQIVGGPRWLASDRFDIEATTGRPEPIGASELGPLLRSLLAGRFHLVTHKETREMQTYVLVIDKGGPKLRESTGAPAQSMRGVNQRATSGTAKMIGEGVNMAALAYRIAQQQPFLGHTVLDRTGLTGFYDLTLEWEAGDDAGPSILSALRTQLGLKLTSEKNAVEVLVIDTAERPSAN